MEPIKIVKKQEAIHVVKEDRTIVDYYLFNEYEIHHNILPALTIQGWHYHQNIEEVIFIIDGSMEVMYQEMDICKQIVYPGDIVQVKQSIHTFRNPTNEPCTFIVFRLVLDGKDKRNMIKNDKTCVDINQKMHR